MGLSIDVYDRVTKESESLRLTNIVGNLAREQIMMNEVKSICSKVRNVLRENVSFIVCHLRYSPLTFSKLRDSVFGDKVKTLNEFVYEIGVKYRGEVLGNDRTVGGLARLAIFVGPFI